MLTSGRLEALLQGLPSARVAVVGDFCLDVYWSLDMGASEPSLETGKPTQPVREQRYSLGGAGNVLANLHDLGLGSLYAFGAVGDDPFGERLLSLLRELNTDCEGMLQGRDESWQTLAYCKPYVGDDELARLDLGDFNRLPPSMAHRLIELLEASLPRLDVVVVNQQVETGLHTPAFRSALRGLMQRHGDTVFVFDGRHFTEAYPEAWLKVNSHEAMRLCGRRKPVDELVLREEAAAAADELFARTDRPVFVTRGGRGAVVRTGAGATFIPGIETLGRTDTVGAGDSFLAGLSASLAAGATPEEAAQVGNFVARVTVRKLQQTGTATPEEVLDVGREPRYVFEPELADDPRRARHWEGWDIEVVSGGDQPLSLEVAIFDHDGTISTLRQGWELVMEPMMVRAVLGAHYDSADEAAYHKVVGRVRTFIDQTTGIQTLVQMQGLVEMVREFGLVPDEDILDEFGYKAIYNDALMGKVRDRLSRLEQGTLDIADFTMKNAPELLGLLHERGVELYLASGTDQEDVRAEAEALGYGPLFAGRIFGAVGDVTKEAKRIVLDRILQQIGDARGRLVTFGDGPVEIRETRRRGGLAIGVASDEVRRFGLNPHKRSRLVRAGASAIVPDFTQLNALLRFLQLNR